MTREMSVSVLVIEDEVELCEALIRYLRLEGLRAQGVGTLAEADTWLAHHAADVLLLDLGLPDGNGLSWLARRDDLKNKGVIITSARSDALSRVSGIRAGADVYLVKPVLPEEIVSLIENLMRRLRGHISEGWELDGKRWRLTTPDGLPIKLTHSEHALLERLAQDPGQVVDKEDLAISLGHSPDVYDFRRLEIIIRRLRNKVQEAWGQALPLDTAYRRGYAFTADIRTRSN